MAIRFPNANPQQLEAIRHVDGPLLIIAGPGTGKTYTLINRTLNLIINKKVDPNKIFISTFTEKAANELVTRLSNELEKYNIDFNTNEMYIGTFHSICLKILKDSISFTDLKKNFKLYDQFDQQYFIYQHLSSFKEIEFFDEYYEFGTYWDKCENILKDINRLVEELIDYNDLLASNNKDYIFYGKLLETYKKLRVEHNFIDFSSIQVETYKLLLSNKELFSKIQNSIDFVMIDEYQDTNHIQERIAFLLSKKNNNLCVVGDDDQSIYRFRGATVRNILEFTTHFTDCKKVELVNNYRSHKDIVKFYNNWMDTTEGRDFHFNWDIYRYNKEIISAKKATLNNKAVMQLSTKEADYINKKTLLFIRELLASGKITNLNQIAFLFRSVKNSSVKELADYLEENGIPIYSPRSNMFFERPEIKGLIGILIYAFPHYAKDMETLSNGHKNPMYDYYKKCKDEAKKILSNPDNKELYEWLRFRIKDHITLASLNYAFSAFIYQLLAFKPFMSMMNVDLSKGINDSRTVRNIGLFIKLLVKFETLNNISILTNKIIDKTLRRLFNTYIRFLHEGGITEYEDDTEYAPSGCVSFITIHQSKGLEFPIVVVGSQSSTPRKQYDERIESIITKYSGRGTFEKLEDVKMFDFWRLYYVAFSRAQSMLVLLCDASKNNEPSKYFEQLYDRLPYDLSYKEFTFEKIKNSSLKNTYSFTSDINVYLTCPKQYMYYKELGFEQVRVGNTLFGTVVHETIEDVHKAVLRGEIDTVNTENIQKWLEINYKTSSQAQNSFLSEAILNGALNQVLTYVDRAQLTWSRISNAEMPISLSENKYIITGKVDLVINKKGDYQILDFKTEKKPDVNRDKEQMLRVRRQLEIYAYLFEKRYGIKVSGMQVYYTSEKDGIPTITFRKDKKKVEETIKTFDEVVKKIENKDFKGQCSDLRICKNCDLRHYCRKG